MQKVGEYNGVIAYLNDQDKNEYNIEQNIITGIKWQCIEFVRRYFIFRHGITFRDVKNVYEMMSLHDFYDLYRKNPIKITFIREMNENNPKKDDIIYIKKDKTGHVGIVKNYDNDTGNVYVVDQNGGNGFYWKTDEYAYVLSKNDASIIGWCRI